MLDPLTGQYYLRARYYNPSIGYTYVIAKKELSLQEIFDVMISYIKEYIWNNCTIGDTTKVYTIGLMNDFGLDEVSSTHQVGDAFEESL